MKRIIHAVLMGAAITTVALLGAVVLVETITLLVFLATDEARIFGGLSFTKMWHTWLVITGVCSVLVYFGEKKS